MLTLLDANADGVLDADEIACISPMSPAPEDTIEALRQQLRSQEKVLMDEKSKSGRYDHLLQHLSTISLFLALAKQHNSPYSLPILSCPLPVYSQCYNDQQSLLESEICLTLP